VDPQPTPRGLADLAVAVAARELADTCYDLVAHLPEPATVTERLERARRIRAYSADVWQRDVLAALLDGDEPAWDTVAACIGWTVASLRGTFQDTVDLWRNGEPAGAYGDPEGTVGHLGDPDPGQTAQTLDDWLARHREPWGPNDPHPVRTALQRA
jgi:hypothetical protein